MSYYTRLELEWDDSEEKRVVEEDHIVERVREYMIEQEFCEDLLDDIRTALKGPHNDGCGFNKMHSELMVEMLEHLSRGFPGTVFFARGTGEILRDMWIRELKNGEVLFAHGPWDE
jgi:hypothetical protein